MVGFGLKSKVKNGFRTLRCKVLVPIDRVIPDDKELSGKTVLISGGSGGIGMAIAKRLYDSGANIVLGGTNPEKLRKCVSDFGSEKRVKTIVMDIADPQKAEDAVSEAARLFDGIDIFVNSAGVHTEDVGLWTMTHDEFDRVLNINLRGAFFAGRAVAKHMISRGIEGHILFVNSSRGFEPAWSPYGVSKWGLRGMTQGFAQLLLPYGIVVNGIAPGSAATPLIGIFEGDGIDTRENGIGRLVMPEEIAEWVKMLVSGSGDMVVGETVLVSGGRGSIDVR